MANRTMGEYLTSENLTSRRQRRVVGISGYWSIGVFVVPSVLYTMLLVVPFLPLTTGQKLWVASGLVVVAEGTFLLTALILGREVVSRYRRFLDPRRWLGKKRRP